MQLLSAYRRTHQIACFKSRQSPHPRARVYQLLSPHHTAPISSPHHTTRSEPTVYPLSRPRPYQLSSVTVSQHTRVSAKAAYSGSLSQSQRERGAGGNGRRRQR
eukprot:3116720-Rhodomonas_salina.1